MHTVPSMGGDSKCNNLSYKGENKILKAINNFYMKWRICNKIKRKYNDVICLVLSFHLFYDKMGAFPEHTININHRKEHCTNKRTFKQTSRGFM